MTTEEAVYFVYYVVFATLSTVLSIAFWRMRNEKAMMILSGALALICWSAVIVVAIYKF